MGVLMGWAATRVLRMLGRQEADSLVRSDDLVGKGGFVSLAIQADGRGFVELSARGNLIRRPARSSDGRALPKNTRIVVIAADTNTLSVEPLENTI